jgi:hypothetical protein
MTDDELLYLCRLLADTVGQRDRFPLSPEKLARETVRESNQERRGPSGQRAATFTLIVQRKAPSVRAARDGSCRQKEARPQRGAHCDSLSQGRSGWGGEHHG